MSKIAILACLLISGTCLAQATKPAQQTAPGATAPPASQPTATKEGKSNGNKGPEGVNDLTPQKRLEACAKVYKEAKNYRDEGKVTQVLKTAQTITSVKPFATAFERGGRFRWQFRDSVMPGGKADQKYTIWSKDGESFSSYWTLMRKREDGQTLSMPLAGATGISSGAATVVVPMLVPDLTKEFRAGTTQVQNPIDAGKETVNGVECWKISGTQQISNAKVTLWLGPDYLIRKFQQVQIVDPGNVPQPGGRGPAMKIDKFEAETTIEITPFINEEKIEDAKFAPDEK